LGGPAPTAGNIEKGLGVQCLLVYTRKPTLGHCHRPEFAEAFRLSVPAGLVGRLAAVIPAGPWCSLAAPPCLRRCLAFVLGRQSVE
jgi:hypothetical protein